MSKNILIEGVEYEKDSESFSFNFKHDGKNDLVKLTMEGPYEVKEYSPCTYYGYVFEDDIDHLTKKKFIDAVKFPKNNIKNEDLDRFVRNSVYSLDKRISLPKYDVIVHPQSSSELNDKIINEIYRKSMSHTYIDFEMMKKIPSEIEFNYSAYVKYLRTKPEINEKNIEDSVNSIKRMMDSIHKKEYLRLGTDVKAKYRQYLNNFYIFKDEETKEIFKQLSNKNILIVDDVSSTQSTILYVLNSLRYVNDTNDITVFCLLGNKH